MEIVDLSYSLDNSLLSFNAPWHTEVSFTSLGKIYSVGRNTMSYTFGSHTATHVDAPLHFIREGKSIDQIDIEVFVGDVSIVDFSDLSGISCVTKEMLVNQDIGVRTIFRFGQSESWGTEKFYSDYPYFTNEAAEYILTKNVLLLGMDTCSPDDPKQKLGTVNDSPIHKVFLSAGVVLLEYLNIPYLDDLSGWKISAVPLKIVSGDGCPVRAFLYKGDC